MSFLLGAKSRLRNRSRSVRRRQAHVGLLSVCRGGRSDGSGRRGAGRFAAVGRRVGRLQGPVWHGLGAASLRRVRGTTPQRREVSGDRRSASRVDAVTSGGRDLGAVALALMTTSCATLHRTSIDLKVASAVAAEALVAARCPDTEAQWQGVVAARAAFDAVQESLLRPQDQQLLATVRQRTDATCGRSVVAKAE